MSEATLLESRVDKIERDNRRLKLTVGALLLALAAVPLIGAVMPERVQDAVFARAFYVQDENGTLRASMNALRIAYLDENGNERAAMDTLGIWYKDENGTTRATMANIGIIYSDENQNPRAAMGVSGIGYADANGNSVWSTRCAPNC